MNILLQPDPQDPRRQFYDHPSRRRDELTVCLAELRAEGWWPVSEPVAVTIAGEPHLRLVLAHADIGHISGVTSDGAVDRS